MPVPQTNKDWYDFGHPIMVWSIHGDTEEIDFDAWPLAFQTDAPDGKWPVAEANASYVEPTEGEGDLVVVATGKFDPVPTAEAVYRAHLRTLRAEHPSVAFEYGCRSGHVFVERLDWDFGKRMFRAFLGS